MNATNPVPVITIGPDPNTPPLDVHPFAILPVEPAATGSNAGGSSAAGGGSSSGGDATAGAIAALGGLFSSAFASGYSGGVGPNGGYLVPQSGTDTTTAVDTTSNPPPTSPTGRPWLEYGLLLAAVAGAWFAYRQYKAHERKAA